MNCLVGKYNFISSILDFDLLLFRERRVVSDIEVGRYRGLFGSVLPNMRSQDLSTRGENNVRCGVVVPENSATINVNSALDFLIKIFFWIFRQLLFQNMQHRFPDLFAILHEIFYSIDCQVPNIVLL